MPGDEFDAQLLAVPERERVADHGQRERPREPERVAVVARIPVIEAEIARDGFRLLAPGDRFDQRQRHRHRRGDSGRRRDTRDRPRTAGPARSCIDGMLLAQLLRVVPVRRRRACRRAGRPPPTTLAPAHTPITIAPLAAWLLDPLQRRRIVVAAHRRHDHVVGAVRMLRIELARPSRPARPSAPDRASPARARSRAPPRRRRRRAGECRTASRSRSSRSHR